MLTSQDGGCMRVGLIGLVAMCFATSVAAQTTVGQLLGNVTDPSGAEVENVSVTLTNADTNEVRKAVSDSLGAYTFPQLPIGTYALTVEHPGFRKVTITG